MKRVRRTFSEEFKAEAVELAEKIGPTKAGRELGVQESSIRRWTQNCNPSISQPKQTISDLEKEVRKLKKELEYVRKINDVLKKSTAIFSQEEVKRWS